MSCHPLFRSTILRFDDLYLKKFLKRTTMDQSEQSFNEAAPASIPGDSAQSNVEDSVSALEDTVAEAGSEKNRETGAPAEGEKPLVESMRVLEALLFAADEILSTEKLKSIVPGAPDARAIRKMVETINVQLQNQRHPFEIVEIGGGYRFRTVSFYYQWIHRLFKEKSAKKLSIQSLECLAIIAYKQPITKAEIEAIRGVLSDGAMKTLLERRLVNITGRSDKAGRPLLYATTQEFLTYFGLNKLADLPRIDEFEALAKEKLGELSEAELKQIETEKNTDEGQEPPPETV
jgi:segregation and condensation protein B